MAPLSLYVCCLYSMMAWQVGIGVPLVHPSSSAALSQKGSPGAAAGTHHHRPRRRIPLSHRAGAGAAAPASPWRPLAPVGPGPARQAVCRGLAVLRRQQGHWHHQPCAKPRSASAGRLAACCRGPGRKSPRSLAAPMRRLPRPRRGGGRCQQMLSRLCESSSLQISSQSRQALRRSGQPRIYTG